MVRVDGRRGSDGCIERVNERSHEFSSHEETGVTGTIVEMTKEL
ncbi:hypothetical protein [Halosolutus gelatinilyticus]|nr:hypothetical protein [Halosolutus gelatinilyticus]